MKCERQIKLEESLKNLLIDLEFKQMNTEDYFFAFEELEKTVENVNKTLEERKQERVNKARELYKSLNEPKTMNEIAEARHKANIASSRITAQIYFPKTK